MTMATFMKKKYLIEWRFSSFIITVGHGGVQADMVLKKELRILHLDPQATGSELK